MATPYQASSTFYVNRLKTIFTTIKWKPIGIVVNLCRNIVSWFRFYFNQFNHRQIEKNIIIITIDSLGNNLEPQWRTVLFLHKVEVPKCLNIERWCCFLLHNRIEHFQFIDTLTQIDQHCL